MSDRERRTQRLRILYAAGAGSIVVAFCVGRATSQTSEIDSYDAAVTSQSRTEALKFIETFGSSHLVGDLIESLPPQVAQQVCAALKGSGPAKARDACDALQKLLAVQPAEPAPDGGPTADNVMAYPLSPGVDASAGVLSDDKPAGEQIADDTENAHGIEVFDRPMTEIPSAGGGNAGAWTSAGADTTAGVSSDAQSAGMHVNDTVTSGGTNPLYSPVLEVLPAASSTAGAPVSAGAGSRAGTPADVEPTREQAAADTDDADGTDRFYRLVTEVAPAAGGTTVGPVSCSVAATTSKPTGNNTQSCRNNANSSKSEGMKAIPPETGTVSVVSTTAAISVTTSTSATTGIQPGGEPDTATSESSNPESSNAKSNAAESNSAVSGNAQGSSGQSSIGQGSIGQGSSGQGSSGQGSSGQGSSGQSSSGQSSSGQSSSGQSSSGQSSSGNNQGSNPQSGSADSSDGNGKGKSKGGQTKGDKDKGSKGKGSNGKGGEKGAS